MVPRILALAISIFAGVTAWAMTVNGIFEQASLDAGHFYAGAGDNLLLLRVFLAVGASSLAILWAFQRGTVVSRFARIMIVPVLFMILVWSVSSLDRYAPGFSEEKFLEVFWAQRNGEILTVGDVEERLGSPLMTATTGEGRTVWSYTYTPSGGFGWRKRVLTFDSRDVLVDALHFDEP